MSQVTENSLLSGCLDECEPGWICAEKSGIEPLMVAGSEGAAPDRPFGGLSVALDSGDRDCVSVKVRAPRPKATIRSEQD